MKLQLLFSLSKSRGWMHCVRFLNLLPSVAPKSHWSTYIGQQRRCSSSALHLMVVVKLILAGLCKESCRLVGLIPINKLYRHYIMVAIDSNWFMKNSSCYTHDLIPTPYFQICTSQEAPYAHHAVETWGNDANTIIYGSKLIKFRYRKLPVGELKICPSNTKAPPYR